jgi:ketosteroid isomerase-like protein
MRVSPFAVVVPAFVLAACVSQDASPAPEAAADAVVNNSAAVAAVTAVREAETASINGGTGDISYLADDAVMMPPGEPALSGSAAIREWIDAFMGQFAINAEYTETDISVSGDWAVERYSAVLTLTPTAGGDAMSETIKGIHVYRRGADGSWKMVYDVWNSDAPPPQM